MLGKNNRIDGGNLGAREMKSGNAGELYGNERWSSFKCIRNSTERKEQN